MATLEELLGPTLAEALGGYVRDTVREAVRAALEAAPPVAGEVDLFTKVFQLAPLTGDYVEFGVYRGSSFSRAYHAARQWTEQLLAGRGDHLVDHPEALRERARALWERRRFFGFDSFAGMPEPEGVDRERVIWRKGTFSTPLQLFQHNVEAAGVPREKTVVVPGFFAETLTDETRGAIGLERVAVVHIDSDLYDSARRALAFVTPALQNGTVLVFDEWFAYRGHPLMGEQRAFAEWREAHPDWLVTEYQTAGVTAKSFLLNHRTHRTHFGDRLAEILE